MKKFIAVILWAMALLAVIGSFPTLLLLFQKASAPVFLGYLIGTALPLVLFIGIGIFLFTFDRAYKMDYIAGFALRQKKNSRCVVWLVFSAVLYFIATIGTSKNVDHTAPMEEILLSYLTPLWPYLLCLFVTGIMLGMYTLCFSACKKNFGYTPEILDKYLSNPEAFRSLDAKETVLASSDALFFPKLFCLIPLACVKSIKLINMGIEQDVVFQLTNGKKITLVTKQYKAIQTLFDQYQNKPTEA